MNDLTQKIRTGAPLPLPLAAVLSALTPLQRAGMWWRSRQPAITVDARVISVGNITAGGTGKTPAVIYLAEKLVAEGGRVAVVTRGYGSAKTGEPLLLAPGGEAPRLVERFGDEPALIRRRVPEVVLVKSANRVAGAQAAVAQFGCTHILLDDGFQSLQLRRDEDLVLIDASNPFGGRRLLPRGILREPLSALARATEIWLTRCDGTEETTALVAELAQRSPGVAIRKTVHRPTGLWQLADQAHRELGWLSGQEVVLLSGVGNPEAFQRTVEGLGARIAGHIVCRDHGASPADLPGEGIVVTTEKDAMRLGTTRAAVYALQIGLEMVDL